MRLSILAGLVGLAVARDSYYFYNLNTGASQHDLPACVGIKDPTQAGTKNSERPYWIVDGKAVWEPSTDCAWNAANTTDIPPQTYYFNSASKAVQWERPDSLAWVNMSKSEADKFYVNSVTTETTRTLPKVLGHEDKVRGATYYLDKDGKASWTVPIEAQWIKAESEEHGRPYFYNPVLNQQTWELPANASIAWQTWYSYEPITSVYKEDL
jgi:hypothetical protein